MIVDRGRKDFGIVLDGGDGPVIACQMRFHEYRLVVYPVFDDGKSAD